MYFEKKTKAGDSKWYRSLDDKERDEVDRRVRVEVEQHRNSKPALLSVGEGVVYNFGSQHLTHGKVYNIFGHFCTLVIYSTGCKWMQHVTIENDRGMIVRININKFRGY